jgi:Cu-Zn family superoxide dismutase
MGRTKFFGVAAALAISSSVALALTVNPGHWMGTVSGLDGAKTTGTGMMMATADGAGTDVTLDLKGETASVTRPWHVHLGTCAKGGGVFGGGRAYTPITVDDKGNGSAKATLMVAVPDTGTYHINVHESSANMSKIVACGDLSYMK